jgi:hypothetical protein
VNGNFCPSEQQKYYLLGRDFEVIWSRQRDFLVPNAAAN